MIAALISLCWVIAFQSAVIWQMYRQRNISLQVELPRAIPTTNNPFEYLAESPERPPAERAPDEMKLDKAVAPKLPIGI